jgi:hypothetical protein
VLFHIASRQISILLADLKNQCTNTDIKIQLPLRVYRAAYGTGSCIPAVSKARRRSTQLSQIPQASSWRL